MDNFIHDGYCGNPEDNYRERGKPLVLKDDTSRGWNWNVKSVRRPKYQPNFNVAKR